MISNFIESNAKIYDTKVVTLNPSEWRTKQRLGIARSIYRKQNSYP